MTELAQAEGAQPRAQISRLRLRRPSAAFLRRGLRWLADWFNPRGMVDEMCAVADLLIRALLKE